MDPNKGLGDTEHSDELKSGDVSKTKIKKGKKRKAQSPRLEEEGDTQTRPPSHKLLKVDGENVPEKTNASDQMSENKEEQQQRTQTAKKRKKSEDSQDEVEEDDAFIPPEKLPKTGNEDGGVKRKKHVRKRLKFLLQAVRDQMEFYFSDSNLSKDRFMKQFMDQNQNGYVDLSIFGNFNKLQALDKDGVSLKILTKALEHSKVLQLSEDKSKVRRTTPFKEISPDETNQRTVYVEYLPNHATHAWIQTIFAPCGKVVYVSLPKYPSTHQIKGFAFVEFESAEEAEKACNMLNNPPPAKEGDKAGKFPKGNKALYRLEKIVPNKPEETSNEENLEEEGKDKEEGAKKKKKKKGKKKGQGETATEGDQPSTVQAQTPTAESSEGKKKKKKKKRKKQDLPQDGSTVKKEEESVKDDKEKDSVKDDKEKESVKGEKEKEIAKNEKEKDSSKDEKEKDLETEMSVEDPDKKEKAVTSTDSAKAPDEGDKIKEKSDGDESNSKKKRKKRKKRKASQSQGEADSSAPGDNTKELKSLNEPSEEKAVKGNEKKPETSETKPMASDNLLDGEKTEPKHELGRKERKRLRQEDIRRKKREREALENATKESAEKDTNKAGKSEFAESVTKEKDATSVAKSEGTDSEREVGGKTVARDGKELTSCLLKTKRLSTHKRVEFDPVPVTQEFVRGKEVRKRKKSKKDKLQLRVISKKEWLSLRAEYITQQKSHMTALKESLRELRQQENQNAVVKESTGPKHVDLQDVFGTKRLKPSQDVKMAHVEALKFTPNVIVQWKASNEMHRDKIRTMFKDISGDSIAYIDAQEEAKSGYIRFKDEASAEHFAKLSRHSNSFSARVLPVEKQQTYWDKANEDRMKKLGRKKQEKGTERIARKVFERNKVTFHEKPSRIKFEDSDDDEKKEGEKASSSGATESKEKEDGPKASSSVQQEESKQTDTEMASAEEVKS